MKSTGFRILTGAIVTLLLVLFVGLIGATLVRFSMAETVAEGRARSGTPAPPAALETPAELDSAPVAEPVAEPDALEADPTGAASDFAVTIQPTPTRRTDEAEPPPGLSVEPEAEPAATGGLPLPTPDPLTPPEEPLQFFGNPNWVQDLDFEGNTLWAATSGGALRWEPAGAAQPTPTLFTTADGLATSRLTAVANCPLEDFGVVFGSTAGLQVYNPDTDTWKRIVGGGAAIRHSDVSALACDAAQGVLVVGYATHGLDVFRANPGRWSYTDADEAGAPQGVSALALGNDGSIWVASGGALALLDGTRMNTYDAENSPLTGESITGLAVDAEGALWATAGDRLYRQRGGGWEVYSAGRAQGDFPAGVLADVRPAQSGRVWLLSEQGEVCRFDPEFESCVPFYSAVAGVVAGADGNAVEGMVGGPAQTLAVNAGGRLAYATAGQGSSLLDRGRWLALAQPGGFPAGARVFALATDARGFLWVAGSSGVQQADPAQPQRVAHLFTAAQDGVLATNVRTLYADPHGGVWLGGIGASHYDGRRWTHYTQADGLAGDEITAIAEDNQGRIWFGTRTGLSIWTGTTFFNLTAENGLPDGEILALAADGSGMWIGSAAGGLYRFEQNQLQVLTQENVGLPSNHITALLAAADGTLLVGTDAGLAEFRNGAVALLEGLPEERITTLAAGPAGTRWVGMAQSGLFRSVDGQRWEAVDAEGTGGSAPSATLPAAVRALAVDLYGGAWVAGDGAGLLRVSADH